MTRRSVLVIGSWLLLAPTVILMGAPAEAQQPLAPLGAVAIDSGAGESGYAPWGTIDVPEGAVEVRVDLDWNVTSVAQMDGAYLDLCLRPCHDSPDYYRRTARQPPMTWTVELPATATISWHLRSEAHIAKPANATGTLTFLGHADATPSGNDPAANGVPVARTDPVVGPRTVGTVAVVVGSLVTLVASVPALRRWGPGLLAPLYSRIPSDEALENETRRQIYDRIQDEPGIHLRAIRRAAGTGGGTLEHHLDVLERAGLIQEIRSGGYRCFFPREGLDRELLEQVGPLRTRAARRILAYVVETPGASLNDVANAADIAPSTASYHVGRLRRSGLLRKDEHGKRLALHLTDLGQRAVDTLGLDPHEPD